MEPEKTPGSDGIPAEFYKILWDDISEHLVTSINHAYQKEQFSVTQRRGIIKLIPKKDTEPYLIKNWRPITLLNCDYKIEVAHAFYSFQPLIHEENTVTENNKITNAGMSIK